MLRNSKKNIITVLNRDVDRQFGHWLSKFQFVKYERIPHNPSLKSRCQLRNWQWLSEIIRKKLSEVPGRKVGTSNKNRWTWFGKKFLGRGYIKRDDDWSLSDARDCRTMNLFSPRRRTNHCPVTIRSTVIIHEWSESDDARLLCAWEGILSIHGFKT